MIFQTGRDSNEPLSNYRHRVANNLFSAQALEGPKTEGVVPLLAAQQITPEWE
jgi:hypothetical protein